MLRGRTVPKTNYADAEFAEIIFVRCVLEMGSLFLFRPTLFRPYVSPARATAAFLRDPIAMRTLKTLIIGKKYVKIRVRFEHKSLKS